MAQRFESIFYDDDGIRWRLAIDDDNHSGSSTDIRLTGSGFVTTWEGDETTPYCGIMASSTSIEVANEGGDFAVFLSEIANKNEGDVRVRIYDNQTPSTTLSNDLWWAGVVLIDGIQQEDRPAPTTVTLQAIDDLATLKTIRIASDLPTGYPAAPSVPNGLAGWLTLIFHRCRNYQALAATDPLWRTVLDFQPKGYDESQFGSAYPGPKVFEQITIGVGYADNEINPIDGTRPRVFMWDVLQSIAITFNARVFFARGCWNVWPVNVHLMDAAGGVAEGEVTWADKVYGYNANGSDTAYPSGSVGQLAKLKRYHLPGLQMGLDGSGGSHPERDALTKINGGMKFYSTPVKFVKRQQEWRHTHNLAQQSYIFGGTQFTDAGADHLLNSIARLTRFVVDDDREFFAGATFTLNGTFNFGRAANAYPGTADTCKLKIDIVWDCGVYRWKGQGDGWSTDQTGSVSWYLGQDNFSTGVSIIEQIAHSTEGHPLPADSDGMELTVTCSLHNGYGGDISANLITGSEGSEVTCTLITVLALDFLNGENTDQLHFISETAGTNTVTVDQGTVLFGSTAGADSTGHITKLSPLSGYSWVDDDKWGSFHDVDQDKNINRLGVNEIAGMQERGREIESGELKLSSDCNPLTPLVTLRSRDVIGGSYDQDYWAPLTMSFSAGTRTATVSRIRLDWDGALNNVSDVTDDEGSNYVDETEGDASNPGEVDGDPTSPNDGGGGSSTAGHGVTFSGPSGGMIGVNHGRKLADIQDKTDALQVDPGNGLTSITVKSGSKPLTSDEVDDSSATNKFSTAAQLEKVDYISVTASTDVDDLKAKSQAHFVALDVSSNNAAARTGQVGVEVAWWDADGQLGSVGDGTSGQVLSTNGSGVLSWTTPAAGGNDGWHGSTTAIKVLPHEFTMNDDYTRAPLAMEDDTSNTLGIRMPATTAEAYATVAIPDGFDATHVQVHASASTASAVEVYQYNHQTGATVSKGSGAFNSSIDITDITSSATASLVIKIIPASSTTLIYGATVTITET